MKVFVAIALLVVGSQAQDQQPKVWDALKVLRGNKDLTIPEITDILANAVAGRDYPNNAAIPEKEVNCGAYAQPGFYADADAPSNCQVFHRCDLNGQATSYLCPNMTLFNQITLICDWFYNVDCKSSKQFENYSNSRLGDQNAKLLDDQMEIEEATGAVAAAPAAPARAPAARAPAARAPAARAPARGG